MLEVIVNGEPHRHQGNGSLLALVQEIGARPERTAVMLNGRVVKRAEWDAVRLATQDRVDVLMFAGGG